MGSSFTEQLKPSIQYNLLFLLIEREAGQSSVVQRNHSASSYFFIWADPLSGVALGGRHLKKRCNLLPRPPGVLLGERYSESGMEEYTPSAVLRTEQFSSSEVP